MEGDVMNASKFFRSSEVTYKNIFNQWTGVPVPPVTLVATHQVVNGIDIATANTFETVFTVSSAECEIKCMAIAQNTSALTGETVELNAKLDNDIIWEASMTCTGSGNGAIILGSLLSTGELLSTGGYRFHADKTLTINMKTATSTGLVAVLLYELYFDEL